MSPDSVGTGSVPRSVGRDRVSEVLPDRITASGPCPPGDKVSPSVVTAGEMTPVTRSSRSVASNGLQVPFTRLRIGSTDSFSVKLPFAFAVNCSVDVSAAVTATAFPVSLA